LTVTIFSSLVCYAATKGYKFILTNSIFPLLSVVVSEFHFSFAIWFIPL